MRCLQLTGVWCHSERTVVEWALHGIACRYRRQLTDVTASELWWSGHCTVSHVGTEGNSLMSLTANALGWRRMAWYRRQLNFSEDMACGMYCTRVVCTYSVRPSTGKSRSAFSCVSLLSFPFFRLSSPLSFRGVVLYRIS